MKFDKLRFTIQKGALPYKYFVFAFNVHVSSRVAFVEKREIK